MTLPVQPEVLRKIRKLIQLPEEVRRSRWAVPVTRLTVLKSLCRTPEVANRFVTYLARKTFDGGKPQRRPTARARSQRRAHLAMMSEALSAMDSWIRKPDDKLRQRLWDLLVRMRDEQNEYRRLKRGAVRVITDWQLLLFEYALHCVVSPDHEAGHWAYQMARHFAEKSNASQGSDLTSLSVPMLEDIADFWTKEFNVDPTSFAAPAGSQMSTSRTKRAATRKTPAPAFTHRQGQFLAFIHLYRKLHRQGPAELDMVRFFRVTPPSAHGMVVKLEQMGLVTREPGVSRSVKVAIPVEQIPSLDEVEGSAC
jgi:hypothetical protein